MNLVHSTWTSGLFGGAVSVDSDGQYLFVPELDLSGTQAITIVAWVRSTEIIVPGYALFELSSNFNGF